MNQPPVIPAPAASTSDHEKQLQAENKELAESTSTHVKSFEGADNKKEAANVKFNKVESSSDEKADECSAKTIEGKLKTLLEPALRVGDSEDIRKMKETFNKFTNDLQVARSTFNAAERKQREMEGQVEKAPGAVQKMQLKWKAIQSQKEYESASRQLELMTMNFEKAQSDLVKKLVEDCQTRRK